MVSVVVGGELTGERIEHLFRVRLTDELMNEMKVIPKDGLLSKQIICRFMAGNYDFISTLHYVEDGTWTTYLQTTIRNPSITGGTDGTWSSIDQIVTDTSLSTGAPIQNVYFQLFNSAKLDRVLRDRSDSLEPLPELQHIRVVLPEPSSLLERREGAPHCIFTDYFEMEY